jgi:DNA invertase Pin-like site-specific DNA recombinase
MADAPRLLPAVGYVRVSLAREEMVSPEIQRTASEQRAARDGYYIAKWIEELDASGRGFARKGVQEVISDVRDGTLIDGQPARRVYVWKYSRFGRNATLNGVYAQEIEDAGGSLISATEDIDASTTVGKFTRGMIWQVDELYSDIVGDQWKEAHARRRKNGLPHNGNPRFGYLYHSSPVTGKCRQGCEPGKCETGYLPDPATAPHAEWMFAAYNEGTSVLKIAVRLNSLGLYTPAGKPWNQVFVRKYMDSGFAAGMLRVHDTGHDGCQKTQCPVKVLVPGAHDAIIGEEAWEEYQRQRKARRHLPPRVESPSYPLAGLMRCGRCGGPLHAHGMTYRGVHKKGYLYQCSTYMRSRECKGTWIARHRVEAVVLKWLLSFEKEAGKAARAESGRVRVRQTADLDRKRLEGQVRKIDGDLTQLTIQLARKVVPEAAYARARDELLAERETATVALESLPAPPAVTRPVVALSVGLAEEWDTFPVEAKQQMIGSLIERIEVQSHGKGRAAIRIVSVWGEVYFYGI